MSYVDDVLLQAEQFGGEVAQAVAAAVAYRDRAIALDASVSALRSADERARTQVIRALAEGQLSPSEVPSKVSDAWVFDSSAVKTVFAAAMSCRDLVGAAVRDAAPGLYRLLQARAASTVEESVRLAADIPPVVTDERSAFAASKRAGFKFEFATWERLSVLVEQFDAVHRLAWVLLNGNLLPGAEPLGQERRAAPWLMWKAPERLRRMGPTAGPLVLAKAAGVGAGPGLHDWAFAVAQWRRYDLQHALYVANAPMQVLSAPNDGQFPPIDKKKVELSPLPPVKPAPPHVEVAQAVAVVGAPSKPGAPTRANEFSPLAS